MNINTEDAVFMMCVRRKKGQTITYKMPKPISEIKYIQFEKIEYEFPVVTEHDSEQNRVRQVR